MAQGLEAVFLMHRDTLLRFLRARGAGDAAEDLVQEVWLRASGADSGPIAEPLSYLYRTANNLMLDRHRSHKRREQREQDWTDAESADPSVSEAPSAERVLLARDQLRRTQEELDALGERTATIFRLFRVEGVPQKQIATDLGVSLTTVEKHLQKAYRAMIELRRRFDAE